MQPSTWVALRAIIQRDVLLAFRQRNELFTPLGFYVLVVSLFPLAISADRHVLSLLAPGVIWVAALLATLLALGQLFHSDFVDGTLEQLLLSRCPLPLLAGAKVAVHWLVTGLPLIVITPLLALLLNLPLRATLILLASLALGTPTLSLIGAIGVALTVGLRNAGVLLALIVLPLYVPVLIFGAGAVKAAMNGMPVSGELLLLSAFLILTLTLTPLAIAAALRVVTE